MERLWFVLVTVLTSGVAAYPEVQAAEPVSLRASIEASGEDIWLSDLFEPVASTSDAAIARAPAPGRLASLEADWLRAAAAAHGVTWGNDRRMKRVPVRRASQTISTSELDDLIADQFHLDEGGSWSVSIAGPAERHAPVDAEIAPIVRDLELDHTAGRFVADVSLGPDLDPIRLTGRAEGAVELPAPARTIARGETITLDDIAWIQTPTSRVPANAIRDVADITGFTAKRPLRPNTPLRSFDLQRPTVIAKGDIVRIVYQRGAMTLTTRGRALADAGAGETARFANTQSGRVIEAQVEAAGIARVQFAPIGGAS